MCTCIVATNSVPDPSVDVKGQDLPDKATVYSDDNTMQTHTHTHGTHTDTHIHNTHTHNTHTHNTHTQSRIHTPAAE